MFINRESFIIPRSIYRQPHRHGVSMMMVMVSLSTALVLTYAILQTQSITSQVSQNALRTDLASQAAQTGAAVALERMQSPDWKGVTSPLNQTIYSDGVGTASYTVSFQQYSQPAAGSPTVTTTASTTQIPGDNSLVVRVLSLGQWQSSQDINQQASRTVEVLVMLQPRFPGRSIVTGDNPTAEDVAANPGDYDAIQKFALVAGNRDDSKSLVMSLRDRIDGTVWVNKKTNLYNDLAWSGPARSTLMQNAGATYVTSTGGSLVVKHPHPFGGAVTLQSQPDGGMKSDLQNLAIPWTQTKASWMLPAIDYTAWQQYRLYQGGFRYVAQQVSASLQNITLRPNASNPLGVYYAQGSLTLGNDVTIQGTLVCNGNVNITGNRVRITSYNWLDHAGFDLVNNAKLAPRLPAVVAQNVWFSRDTTAVVEGAVVVSASLTGDTGRYELTTNSLGQILSAEYNGTATAKPLQQPWSEVTVSDASALKNISSGEQFAIWLTDGASGAWYPITAVDAHASKLTVIGEARFDSPTAYRIKGCRKRSVDLRGPVYGAWSSFNRPDDWGNLTASQWSTLYAGWQSAVSETPKGKTPIKFLDYLANPQNYPPASFPTYYSQYGLTLEPTLHVRNAGNRSYRWTPPLFDMYTGTPDNGRQAGYRWKVLSWREVEPGSIQGVQLNAGTTVTDSAAVN